MKCKTQNQGPLWFSLLRLAEQWGWWWKASERTVQDRLLRPCVTGGCSAHHGTVRSTNSTPSLIHTAPREAAPPVQRPYSRLQLTGPRVSMQAQSGPTYRISENLNLTSSKMTSSKMSCSFSARLPCSLRKTNLQRKEKTEMDTVRKAWIRAAKSWDQSAGMFPRSSCLPNFGF